MSIFLPPTQPHAARRWYRGDFHAHSNCSDGIHPPSELIALAKQAGLDFFTITDHNSIEAFAQLNGEAGILVLRGIEITFTDGHFNTYGIDGRLDWMDQVCTGRFEIERMEAPYHTRSALMRQMAAQGLLNSINHPYLSPYHWQDHATELRNLTCFEIWNDPLFPANGVANREAIATWTAMLNAGYRLTAIGGSDYHRPTPWPEDNKPAEQLGLPSTYVLASELSAMAIYEAVRERHVYVSMGPQVAVQALLNGTRYDIGDDLEAVNGEAVFSAHVMGAPEGARAQWVCNGQLVAEAVLADGQADSEFRTIVRAAEPQWVRLDVRDLAGELLVVTNPFFAGLQIEPRQHTFGDFVRAPAA